MTADELHPEQTPAEFPADTPLPPYYAVIFTSVRRPGDDAAYAATATRMAELAMSQRGYLGIESVRDADGQGITVSYWTDLEAVEAWKRHAEHLIAQRHGREVWYSRFRLRIGRVESDRSFQRSPDDSVPAAKPADTVCGETFADLVAARKGWIQQSLRAWCQRASRKDLLLAEPEWFDIAGKADPARTLWAWAWSRFPELVHLDLGIDESAEVEVTLKDGRTIRGYPDARKSLAGRLVLIAASSAPGPSGPIAIDEISTVRRVPTPKA
ncbi:MAG: antibiotic biosynthesis monooxygenase [Planctomycetaceae bacterium]|nr:antibiotic biosynthesis monooxygenase [Planctomycetaceae bacterium]